MRRYHIDSHKMPPCLKNKIKNVMPFCVQLSFCAVMFRNCAQNGCTCGFFSLFLHCASAERVGLHVDRRCRTRTLKNATFQDLCWFVYQACALVHASSYARQPIKHFWWKSQMPYELSPSTCSNLLRQQLTLKITSFLKRIITWGRVISIFKYLTIYCMYCI